MRRRRTVEVASRLPVERAAERLSVSGLLRTRREGLAARVRDGRVRARVPNTSRYDTHPTLRGTLQPAGSGSVLHGVVRESPMAVLVPWTLLAPGLLLLLVFTGLLVGDPGDRAGLLVCGLGGPALTAVGVLLRRQRAGTFRQDAEDLVAVLRERLRG